MKLIIGPADHQLISRGLTVFSFSGKFEGNLIIWEALIQINRRFSVLTKISQAAQIFAKFFIYKRFW